MTAKLLLPRFSPILIISAGSFTGILFITCAIWLALHQPWLGIEIKFEAGNSTLKILNVLNNSPAYNYLKPGDEILGFEHNSQYLPVSPLHNIEDPDSNPSYTLYNEFMHKQSELHELLLHESITIKLKDKNVTLYPQPTRPISSLSLTSFWMVIVLGYSAFIIVLSIWSFRRGIIHIRILGLLGIGFFIGAVFNAVTLSRELVLPGELFYTLSSLNILGIMLFSISITALLWNYPRRLSEYPTTYLMYSLYPVIWINQTWQLIELPLHTYYLHYLITFSFLIIFAIRQWYQSRDSVEDQYALQWLLLSITISLGVIFFVYYIPAIFSDKAYVPVSFAYVAAFMIFLGLIMGIVKYKLFNLSRLWVKIWVWIISGSVLLLIDLAFIFVLELTSSLTFVLSALIVAWLYFPGRYWFSINILKLQPRSIEHYFPVLIQKLVVLKSHKTMNHKWEEILREIFLPLNIKSINEPRNKLEIINNGANLLVPALNNNSTLLLQYQNKGKKLYSKADLNLCNSLYEITQYTANSKKAHEKGMTTERQRISRDLIDDIVTPLQDIFQNSDEADVTNKANEILKSLRETINSLDTESTINIQTVLSNLEIIISERLKLANIQLNIDTKITDHNKDLNPRQHINLQRILQELISNILKHANARQVNVVIRATDSELTIEICDDGVGGDLENWIAGKGLNNITKRIAEINGEVSWSYNNKINNELTNNGCCTNFKLPI